MTIIAEEKFKMTPEEDQAWDIVYDMLDAILDKSNDHDLRSAALSVSTALYSLGNYYKETENSNNTSEED